MSDIKIKVVNSTVGLGNTEYSLCDGRGLLKFDKGAMDECCQMINNHDAMAERIKVLENLLKDTLAVIKESPAVVDTVWFNEHTTLCDKIELTLNE